MKLGLSALSANIPAKDRSLAKERLLHLFERDKGAFHKLSIEPEQGQSESPRDEKPLTAPLSVSLERNIHCAGLNRGRFRLTPTGLRVLRIACAVFVFSLARIFFSISFAPAFSLFGFFLPDAWLNRCIRNRARLFAEDYSAMLMATASSIQVGMTPYQALERATRLFPKESLVKREVDILLRKLREGIPKEQAISEFADSYLLPELELFRSAFLLVMETGGRFSPTLQRLAEVSNNRMMLLKMAAVSTASMKMTANVLLFVLPLLVLFLSMRIENYWELIRTHPTANALASLGLIAITAGYLTLRRMSFFRP